MRFIILVFLLLFSISSLAQAWTNEMDSLAHLTETKYSLPHGTCRAFALQESNYNQYAIRTEANYLTDGGLYAKNIRKQAVAFSVTHRYQPSILTEIVQRSQSYTLFQIMGTNLRELGLKVSFFQEDLVLQDQFMYFGVFISRLVKKHKGNMEYVASEYNGGSRAIRGGNYTNKGYVKNIMRNLEKFKY